MSTPERISSECPRCALGDYTRTKRDDGIRHKATEDQPDIEELQEWNAEGGCMTTDGCWVEPDGHCEHGHSSWLLALRMI